MAAAGVGGVAGGLYGLSLALLVVRYTEALVTAPAVFRAAFGPSGQPLTARLKD